MSRSFSVRLISAMIASFWAMHGLSSVTVRGKYHGAIPRGFPSGTLTVRVAPHETHRDIAARARCACGEGFHENAIRLAGAGAHPGAQRMRAGRSGSMSGALS